MQASKLWQFILGLLILALPIQASGAWIFKDGKLIDVTGVATHSPEDHFDMAVEAWNCHDWDEAAQQFSLVITNYPNFSRVNEAIFYCGASLYFLAEYDTANNNLTTYLQNSCSPEFLEEAMEYKYAIAEAFRGGEKRRIFGSRRFPKLVSGYDTAIKIYDEIISTLPCHELAAQSLYAKGCLLCEMRDFRCSIEAYQALIRRFPLHELAPESYLAIMNVYLTQAKCEFQNPDLLPLSEIVLRRFQEDFPNEERLEEASNYILELKEVYACGLYQTGLFYERTCKPQASVLYYSSAIQQFPETCVAANARERIGYLLNTCPGLDVPEGTLDADETL